MAIFVIVILKIRMSLVTFYSRFRNGYIVIIVFNQLVYTVIIMCECNTVIKTFFKKDPG